MKAEFLRMLGSGLGDVLSMRGKSLSGGRSSVWASSIKEWNESEASSTKRSGRIIAVTNRTGAWCVYLKQLYSTPSKRHTLLTTPARIEIPGRPGWCGITLFLITVFNTNRLNLQTELALFLITKKDSEPGYVTGIQFLLREYAAAPSRHKLINW